jgi:hypothetical protein
VREAWQEKWLEIILECVTGGWGDHDKEDAAEWLITYLGWGKYENLTIILSACSTLGRDQ